MSNRREHQELSGVVSAFAYLLAKKAQNEPVDTGTFIASIFGGVAVGGLPDIIEPATGANHRGPAHSWTAAVGTVHLSKQAWESPKLKNEQKAFLIAMGAAYLSHLLADSDTPAGLPLLE